MQTISSGKHFVDGNWKTENRNNMHKPENPEMP